MYTEEEIQRLRSEENELTEEELILLLATLYTTLSSLETVIRDFYSKYGSDGVVTFSEVKKWVSNQNHIKRMVYLNQLISDVFDAGFTDFEKAFISHLRNIVNLESKFYGVLLDVDAILNTAWGVDKSTFIKRLAAHKKKWMGTINNDLKISILRQDSILDVLTKATKRGESMETILKRLWRTESNAISSISRQKIFKELGIKKYRFLHLDGCQCEICSSMHRQVFPISEYEVGVTANPLHPNCWDTTVPVF